MRCCPSALVLRCVLALVSPRAFAALPPEVDVPYAGRATFDIGGITVRLEGQRLRAGGRVLAERL